MPALVALLVSVVAVWLSFLTPPAGAHLADPRIDTAILSLSPVVDGIEVSVVQGGLIPAVSAYNPSRQELQVLGTDGSAFLRLGPRGTEANLTDPAYWHSSAPSGEARVPPTAFSGASPRWRLISRRPAWAWYDQRVPVIQAAPAAARTRNQPTVMARFTIPLRFAGREVAANGVVEYLPPRASPAAYMTSSLHPAPGLTVALLAGSYPDIYLQNSGAAAVTILGQAGEPFAQVGPAGVRVNLRSPIYAADQLARGVAPPVAVDPARSPLWRRVSAARSFDWLDPRPRYLARWTIPLLYGGRRLAISGGVRATGAVAPGQSPPAAASAGGSGTPWWVFLLAGVALATAAAIALVLHRRT